MTQPSVSLRDLSALSPNNTYPAPAPPPAEAPWVPTDELRTFTSMLVEGQLSIIAHRTHGMQQLQHQTAPTVGNAQDQIRACAVVMRLPFLRISLKLRANPLNSEFVTAGRKHNRELLIAKKEAGQRLREISNNMNHEPAVRRTAAATNARGAFLNVDHGELNDVEIPANLLPPPPEDELYSPWLADRGQKFDGPVSANCQAQHNAELAEQQAAQQEASDLMAGIDTGKILRQTRAAAICRAGEAAPSQQTSVSTSIASAAERLQAGSGMASPVKPMLRR